MMTQGRSALTTSRNSQNSRSIPRGTKQLALHRSAVLCVEETLHLDKPSRSNFAQRLEQKSSICGSAIILQRLGEREKCFIRAKVFDATAQQYTNTLPRYPLYEHVYDGRLTYSGFARDCRLPVTASCSTVSN